MEKKFKLGVIGAGFMATAIIKGIIKAGLIHSEQIIVSDVCQTSLDKIASLNVSTTTDNEYLANNAEFVLFAVKPQGISEVLSQIKNCLCNKFISIMAGVKKQRIKDQINGAKVARAMPNTPCSIGAGSIGLDVSDFDNDTDVNFISKLFSSIGAVVFVLEDKLNAVTGVSGSSPAYFYLFLKGIIESGVKHGLTEQEAKILATNAMRGAAEMVINNEDKTLDDLIFAVCSKGGTTIQAINEYNESDLSKITEKAVDACVKRSVELENI